MPPAWMLWNEVLPAMACLQIVSVVLIVLLSEYLKIFFDY
jgi:hypothetical protein